VQHVRQRGRTEVGHAHGLERIGTVDRVDRDDVGVLQLGERLRFAHDVRRDFQGDETVGEIALFGQIDLPERTAAQDGAQMKSKEMRANRRQRGIRAVVVADRRLGAGHLVGLGGSGAGQRIRLGRRWLRDHQRWGEVVFLVHGGPRIAASPFSGEPPA
jgi:hypothetical protein